MTKKKMIAYGLAGGLTIALLNSIFQLGEGWWTIAGFLMLIFGYWASFILLKQDAMDSLETKIEEGKIKQEEVKEAVEKILTEQKGWWTKGR